MSSEPRFKVFTRVSEVAGRTDFGEVQLGGVTLYGNSPEQLVEAVEQLETTAVGVVGRNPTADRQSMNALVSNEAGKGVSRRVVSAIIGSVLRKGLVSAFPGESESGELVQVVCASARRVEFESRVCDLESAVKANGEMLIRNLRDVFFPGGESGAWSWTWHVAARAAYLGRISFVDRYRITWTGDFDDVLGTTC